MSNFNNNNNNNNGFNRPNFNSPYLSEDAKNKLFDNGGNNNGGRKWGAPQDNDHTRQYSNEQLLEKQRDVMADQDKLLDSLQFSVTRQKEIAVTIGNEAEKQGIMLDDLNDHVDTTSTRLRNTTRGVLRLTQESKTTGHLVCICVLILVLIVVIALAAST